MIKMLKDFLRTIIYGPIVRPHIKELGEFLIENAPYARTGELGGLWFDFKTIELKTEDKLFWSANNSDAYKTIMGRQVNLNSAEEEYLEAVIVKMAVRRMKTAIEHEEEKLNGQR